MRAVLIVSGLVWMFGCNLTDPAALREEVLKTDPAFQEVLALRDKYASQIETVRREFALKRTTVDRAIQELRESLAESQRTVQKRQARYRELMEPERRKLGFAASMAGEELRAKRVQRSSLGRSMARLRKTLQEADATWSSQERARQNARLREMIQDAERLDGEIASLDEHRRLLKLKLRLIRM